MKMRSTPLAERGLTIVVADTPRRTVARYAVQNPVQVQTLLQRLARVVVHITTPDRLWPNRLTGSSDSRVSTRNGERLRETLCTLGNGYFATRGAAEETPADNRPPIRAAILPAAIIAGKRTIAGRTIENEDFVNLPNWLSLTFRPEDGEWLHPNAYEILSWIRELDLKRGILTRTLHVRDPPGPGDPPALSAFCQSGRASPCRHQPQPDPWRTGRAGCIFAPGWTDGYAMPGSNANHQLRSDHLEALLSQPIDEEGMALVVRTNQSQLTIAQAARTQTLPAGRQVSRF